MKTSDFLETLLGTSLYGTIMQVSKRFPFLKPFSIFFVPPKVIRTIPKFFKMTSQEVQRRIDNRGNTTHPDFVDYMLPADAPAPTTKKEKIHIEQVATQLFVAGFDPVQITLFSCIFFLLKNPNAYNTLVEEIRDAFQDYNDITADALVDMKYLNAVIHETLRAHVATVAGLPRKSPGATVAGVYVPKGVSLGYHLFIVRTTVSNILGRSYVKLVTSPSVATQDSSTTRSTFTQSAGFGRSTLSMTRDSLMTTSNASTHFL